MYKRIFIGIIALLAISFVLTSFADPKRKKKKKKDEVVAMEALVTIETKYGDIKLILFDDTPIHKENFLNLAREGKYDSTIFHRVIPNFMAQGGEVDRSNDSLWNTLSFDEKTLQNEILPHHRHLRGSLAAARVNNPGKRSDKSQFYIVQNVKGTPHLNNNYTVFGHALSGVEVVDDIVYSQVKGSTPIDKIYMKVSVEMVPKTDIIKFYGDVYKKYQIKTPVK
jgi:peptidyl-prolyl cis-trans isomerase B (cyclophilin B)